MYVRRFFNPEAKKSMLEMTSYIRKVFKEDIVEGLDWMDENTKARARKKLDQVFIIPMANESKSLIILEAHKK